MLAPDVTIRYGMVWYGTMWYGTMMWYGTLRYGVVWYGVVWDAMVWYETRLIGHLTGEVHFCIFDPQKNKKHSKSPPGTI